MILLLKFSNFKIEFEFEFEKTKIKILNRILKSGKEAQPKLFVKEMNETGLKILFNIVYYRGILFTIVGFCTRL